MTHDGVGEPLTSDALCGHMLGTMLYETADRAKEIMALDVEDLDTVNRCTIVVRKGGTRDVMYWQTGTARCCSAERQPQTRAVVSHRSQGEPSVALEDLDPTARRARLSYRRATTPFEKHTTSMQYGPFTLYQLRHSKLTHAAETGRHRC
ncbi:hypothetical protein [Nocardia gamkensis]|uniref:hypothetical protein n=1 Tax=Nocardia gamkensis TaxID=352869 RepID=UPI0037CBD795